jgi:hypothetical protein
VAHVEMAAGCGCAVVASMPLVLAITSTAAKMLDSSMTSILEKNQVIVEYFCAGITAELADGKVRALQYSHTRSLMLDISKTERNSDDFPRWVTI